MKFNNLGKALRNLVLPAFAAIVLNSAAALAAGSVYILQADGLACPFCAYGIEKQLGRIDGVSTATTDIASGTVIVVMEEGTALDRADANKAVEAAGFSLSGFSRGGQ